LRTAPTSIAGRRALAADHHGRRPACSSRPPQWVISDEQARVISGKRRRDPTIFEVRQFDAGDLRKRFEEIRRDTQVPLELTDLR
jgi:hypothetical protein